MYVERLQLFIKNQQYFEMKQLENELSHLRNKIMEYQETVGLERIVWRKQGVVGYFSRVHFYEEDRVALFDFLYCLGLLPYVVNISWAKLSTEEQQKLEVVATKREGYVRYWPKKTQSLILKELNNDMAIPLEEGIVDLVSRWRALKRKYDQLEKQWALLRGGALKEWGERERKIQLPSGSLSVVRLQPQIHAVTLLKHLDISTLIRSGTINYDRILEFAAKGYFNKTDIDKFRKIKEISIRYILIEIQNEDKKHEYNKRKMDYFSRISRHL
ncbi:hypothetical protein [Paenibacillus tundrae]|uniref:hypothetical protein n=1 Tax=Paenibacillus tundrae TaxID=528187 RepID=UPI0030D0EC3C